MPRRNLFLRNFDVVAVFCLAVLPDVVRAAFAWASTQASSGHSYPFAYPHASLMARSLQVAVPILLIMNLRDVYWPRYGFRTFRPARDTLSALGLVAASYVVHVMVYSFLVQSDISFEATNANTSAMMQSMVPQAAYTIPVVIATSLANGFAEELALRGYLLPRLLQITGSKIASVLLTSLLFAAYHIYQGLFGTLSTLAVGLVLGSYFVATRRFWPLATAHALMDLLAQLAYR